MSTAVSQCIFFSPVIAHTLYSHSRPFAKTAPLSQVITAFRKKTPVTKMAKST